MKKAMRLLHWALIVPMFVIALAHADDQNDIMQLVQNLYREDAKALLCHKPMESSGIDNRYIIVSERYFSIEFMKYYKNICLNQPTNSHGYTIWSEDARTGQSGILSYPDSKAEFTNLYIGQPKITGTQARIRTTYDLPDASYKDFGNFTVFSLIKENSQWKIDDIELGGHDLDKNNERVSMTGLPSIKSLKQYFRKNLIEAEAKTKTSTKKKSPK